MSDTTSTQEEPTPRKRVAPMLARAVIASALLHCVPLLGLLQFEWHDNGFEADWVGTFGDLSGVGHGANGRWAKLDDSPPPPRDAEKKTSPEVAPEDQPEVKPPEVEPPEAKPPEEPEVAKKPEKKKPRKKPRPKKKPPELAIEDKTSPKPPEPTKDEKATAKKDAPDEKAVADKTPDEKTPEEKTPDEPTEDEPKPPTVASRDPGDLPGLHRSGPSNLPNFKDYAPGNARMTALFRLDRIRGSGLDASITDALSAVPDFHILMHSTGVVPTRDLTSVFAASADPRFIQETFWAFRHTMGKKDFKDALSRRFVEDVPWTTYKKMPRRALVPEGISYRDPRSVVLVDDSLALITQPRWLPALTKDLAEDSSLRDPNEPDGPATMLDGVARIEQAADDSDAFAMLTFQGGRFALPGYGNLPYFETARLALLDISSPDLVIDLQFRSPESASKFARDCPKMKADLNSMAVRMMGLSSYITRLECAATNEYVTVSGSYSQAEVIRVLELLHTLMPAPIAVGALPPAPQKTPPADLDPSTPPPIKPKKLPRTPPQPSGILKGVSPGSLSGATDAPSTASKKKAEEKKATEVDEKPSTEKTPRDPDAAPSKDEAK